MKIVICTKKDVVGNVALNHLFKQCENSRIEFTVILSDRVSKSEREVDQATDFVFYERDLLIDHLFPALDSQPLMESPNKTLLSFDQLALKYGVTIKTLGNINDAEQIEYLRSLSPDYLLSIRYNYIFRQPVIDIPSIGVLNIHPGELPQFGGVYCSFRVMQQGGEKIGCTLHYIDNEEIDAGPIISQDFEPVKTDQSVLWHVLQVYRRGVDLFVRFQQKLLSGESIEAEPQDSSKAGYYSYPSKEEMHEFKSRGLKLIDHAEYLSWLEAYKA